MSKGRFGIHGGQYIPETLMHAVGELEKAYLKYKEDPVFQKELTDLYNNYAGRPSMLYYAEHMTKDLGGAKIYLKRDLDFLDNLSHLLKNEYYLYTPQIVLYHRLQYTRRYKHFF